MIRLPIYGLAQDIDVLINQVDQSRESVFRNLPLALRQIEVGGDAQRFLLLLSDLYEEIATAYALRNGPRFAEGCRLALQYSPARVARLDPSKEQLSTSLGIAICLRSDEAPALARSTISADLRMADMAVGYAADILAALQGLDRKSAKAGCDVMLAACTEKRLPKAEAEQALPWARAALAVLDRNGPEVEVCLKAVEAAQHRSLLKRLDRWSRGHDVDLSMRDFWLPEAAALASLAHDAGLIYGPPVSAYFDDQWMRTAG